MGVPAAEQTLAILRYLSSQATPIQAMAIARTLNLPRSTTYHLLNTLIEYGFVIHYPEQQVYGLDVGAYELGTGYSRQEPLQRLARHPIAALADQSESSAHLSVLLGRDVVYVVEERSRGRNPLITDVGVRLPAILTASGRALLAALPSAQIKALYGDHDAFPASPSSPCADPKTPSSLSGLRRMLVDIRTQGWAIEEGAVTEGHTSIAMPVLDGAGYPLAAVAVTFLESERTPEFVDQLVAMVASTTRLISKRLGG